MWEKVRVDGKRILKHNAIPSIFEPTSTTVESSTETNIETQPVCETIEMDDMSNIASDEICTQINEEPRIEPVITTNTENEPNSSPSTGLKSEIYWKKKYEELNDLFKKREKMYDSALRKSNRSQHALKEKVKKLNAEKANLRKQCTQNNKINSIIEKVFTDDQIRVLVNTSTRGYKWSSSTVQKAIRLRISCGSNGYKELLQQHIPLPSMRTIQRRLETLHFAEGICEEILDILKVKVDGFEDERDKDAMLALDEMCIKSGTHFDPSIGSYCGHSSLPNSKGEIGN